MSVRFTHNRDIVPAWPPTWVGFHHVATEIWQVDVLGLGSVRSLCAVPAMRSTDQAVCSVHPCANSCSGVNLLGNDRKAFLRRCGRFSIFPYARQWTDHYNGFATLCKK